MRWRQIGVHTSYHQQVDGTPEQVDGDTSQHGKHDLLFGEVHGVQIQEEEHGINTTNSKEIGLFTGVEVVPVFDSPVVDDVDEEIDLINFNILEKLVRSASRLDTNSAQKV
jgi:hypothetical protein